MCKLGVDLQGKTGLDLPNIHIAPLLMPVKACHTGPDGGLTRVQSMRQRTIAKMAKLDDEEFSLSSMDEEEEGGNEEGEKGMGPEGNGTKMHKNGRRKRVATNLFCPVSFGGKFCWEIGGLLRPIQWRPLGLGRRISRRAEANWKEWTGRIGMNRGHSACPHPFMKNTRSLAFPPAIQSPMCSA